MITVNSISGGRTSAFLAANYPADINIFSLVCIDDVRCKPKDNLLIQKVNDKLEKSGSLQKHGEFIATAEFDVTITTIFELEQFLGQEINWLRGISFDKLIDKKRMTPYKFARFCTSEMKMDVIGNYLYERMELIDGVPQLFMNNVGIRYDEKERAKDGEGRNLITKIHNGFSDNGRNKWKKVHWGVSNYPLVYDRIGNYTVHKFWENKSVSFSDDSNCVGCFWKNVQQLRKNWDDAPNKMRWFSDQEKKRVKNCWNPSISYDNIKEIGIQQDFNFGTGSGCQAGFCTD